MLRYSYINSIAHILMCVTVATIDDATIRFDSCTYVVLKLGLNINLYYSIIAKCANDLQRKYFKGEYIRINAFFVELSLSTVCVK